AALRPEHAPTYFRRGRFRANALQDFEGAAADFGRALALEPGWFQARLNRGKCLAPAGRRAEAVADLDAVLAEQPWNADARLVRARALQQLGRHRAAVADFDRLVPVWPGRASLY